MPGRLNWSRNWRTAGVMSPRSSASSGRPPRAFSMPRKKSAPGPGTHSTIHRRRRLGRDVPGVHEAAEMVQPHHVHLREQDLASARSTRRNSSSCEPPSRKADCPSAARRAEIIGRHSSHHGRLALLVEQEQLRVGPQVRRIAGHEDRYVADQAQPLAVGMGLEGEPLAIEQELAKAVLADRLGQVAAATARAAWFRSTRSAGQSCQLRPLKLSLRAMNRA